MTVLHDKTGNVSPFASPSGVGDAARRPTASNPTVHAPRRAQPGLRAGDWRSRSEKWGCLMVAAQAGESRAYEQLLRELDAWLRRYYARRLRRPAAEDARQEALLAIHAQRQAYTPSRPFGRWVAAIARYKWIDRVRDASRFAALSLHDEIPIEDHGDAAISAIAVDDLLGRLKPAQASVIRLVKLQGVSIEGASGATGQSVALVKVNIHRGLKRLAALVACDAGTPATSVNSSKPRNLGRADGGSTQQASSSRCSPGD
jgi:RNA polymerase sigma factor (sigma-70 family)